MALVGDEYLTTAMIAKELTVSDRVVRLWVAEKLLRATKVGRAWRITRQDLETALRRGTIERGA